MGIQAYSTTGKRIVRKSGTVSFYGKKYFASFLISRIGQEVFIRDYGDEIYATDSNGFCASIQEWKPKVAARKETSRNPATGRLN